MQLLFAKLFSMSEKVDELRLNAWRAFIRTHALLIEQMDSELAEAGQIPLNWYDVLVELAAVPDHRLRMNELARKVVLSRSGLTRLVDRLEEAGLLSRESDRADRRGAYAVLTEPGLAALRQAWPVYAAGIVRHFTSHLSDEEARILTAVLTRMLDAAENRET
jgi:DNA-binding MarR family transcriptional regulator